MFKTQTRGRKISAAIGDKIGLIAIIVVAIILTILVIVYVHKSILAQMRYTKRITKYLRIKRESSSYLEERVQFNLDRFEFSSVLLRVGKASTNLTWDTDSLTFDDLCNDYMGLVSNVSDTSSKYYKKNHLLWKQILYAIKMIADKLPDIP